MDRDNIVILDGVGMGEYYWEKIKINKKV